MATGGRAWLVFIQVAGSGAVQESSGAGRELGDAMQQDRRSSGRRRRRLRSCFNARVELVAFLLGVE